MLIAYDRPLLEATLLKRYKRFLADVRLSDGREVTVHCPNSGAMTSCCEALRPIIVSDSQNDERKLRHTWEMIRMGKSWVGVHSAKSNSFVEQLVRAEAVPELRGYTSIAREVPYGKTRASLADLVLTRKGAPRCYVEVKHASLRVGEHAAFPDSVSERGQKHLRALTSHAKRGNRAVAFFAVGRTDCARFRPSDETDPEFGRLLRLAERAGVELLAYQLEFSPRGVRLGARLPVDL